MKIVIVIILLLIALPAIAQQMKTDTTKSIKMNRKKPVKKAMQGNMGDMDMGNMQMDSMKPMGMTSQYSREIPMNRDGSGTSWVPDETPHICLYDPRQMDDHDTRQFFCPLR